MSDLYAASNHPILDRITPSNSLNPTFSDFPFLRDHGFQGMTVLPGAFYAEWMLAQATQDSGALPAGLQHLSFERIFLLPESGILALKKDASSSFSIHGADSERFAHGEVANEAPLPGAPSLELSGQERSKPDVYAALQQNGNAYGPAFQAIQSLEVFDSQARANILLPDAAQANTFIAHPVLLDACVQTLIASQFSGGHTLVLSSIDALYLHGESASEGHAEATFSRDGNTLRGSVVFYAKDGRPVLSMEGVSVKELRQEEAQEKTTVAVAATFTAEPIEASLAFWMNKFDQPANIAFAPYNQPFQQLLDPNSLLSQNEQGANLLLIRLEDWIQGAGQLSPQASPEQQEVLLNEVDSHTLPNGAQIAHLNPYETDYLYKEIFADRAYLRHGISIADGDTVIDIGANIGMFTMMTLQEAPNARVYAFEPSPAAFKALATNGKLFGKHVKPFQCGVSDQDGEANFTFYKHSSVFSSFEADVNADHEAIRQVVENTVRQHNEADVETLQELTDSLMDERLESETLVCPLRSLSSIIDQENITQIDLLKVDAEKSELHVLNGIEARHWPMIKQIVLEVHDTEGPLIAEVEAILRSHGFELKIEEEELLQESGLYNLYGIRTGHEPAAGSAESRQLSRNMDDLAQALEVFTQRNRMPLIIGLTPSSANEHDALFAQARQHLAERLIPFSSVYLLEEADVLANYPVADVFDADAEALGNVPYTPAYFAALGTTAVRKLQTISRKPYKVIVLDCDNTLWKGVAGEDGPAGVEIDPARREMQAFLLRQRDAGMVLCLCSKNVEEDVTAVFTHHSDMPLQLDHVVAHRINWQPKSDNLKSLAKELNLGLDSFIFIDDNPVECAEVKARCPEVLTLQLPADDAAISSFLTHQWAFDRLKVTDEDRLRSERYQQNAKREAFRSTALTFADFIEGLNLQVDMAAPKPAQLPRVSQMTQRTNQFNFTTIRRTEREVAEWLGEENQHALAVDVRDRFGDYGLTGMVLYRIQNDVLAVDSMLLSCRVLGKGVEHQMIQRLGERAQAANCKTVFLPFVPTRKNQPASRFLEQISRSSQPVLLIEDYFGDNGTPDGATGNGLLYAYQASTLANFAFDPAAQEAANETTESKTSAARVAEPAPQVLEEIASAFTSIDAILASLETKTRRERPALDTQFSAPSDDLESSIASIWTDILEVEPIGVHDHFFALGGSSLKAVQAISRLRSMLGISIPTVSLFDKATVAEIAALVRDQSAGDGASANADIRKRGEQRRARRSRRRASR